MDSLVRFYISLNHETSDGIDESLSQREGTEIKLSIIQRVRNFIVILVHVLIFLILISYLLLQKASKKMGIRYHKTATEPDFLNVEDSSLFDLL
jgi:hypothetical protein